jgi:GxxExxY protein
MSRFQSSIINDITRRIIAAAIEVHRHLGPGLLESSYQACMAFELSQRQLRFKASQSLPVRYKGVRLDCGYRIDVYVEDLVVVELKCIEAIAPIHIAQLMTYLRLSGAPTGLLINFNVPLLKLGIRRRLNNIHEVDDA